MLHFKIHEFNLSGWHYILLPKLTSEQMKILARRFGKPATPDTASYLEVKSKDGTIRIDRAGLCRSGFDPADAILPIIPEILERPKEQIRLRDLTSLYFRTGRSQEKTVIRFSTRLEASARWDALRAAAECGLSPDEHAVVSAVLRMAEDDCFMTTNYPFDGATTRIYGKRQYYEGTIDSTEAASALFWVDGSFQRRCYLPRDATLTFKREFSPSGGEFASLFRDLGEWCFFTPSKRESSN